MPEIDETGLWRAMQHLAGTFRLEESIGEGTGIILGPEYGEDLAHATLQFQEDGRLWLGSKDGRKLVAPWPEGEGL